MTTESTPAVLFRTDDKAWEAAAGAARHAERRSDIIAKAVGAAAPIIVAAELRRLADRADKLRMAHTPVGDDAVRAAVVAAYALLRDEMDARADELDPPA